jgi:broad specificity phosphatase PhoE
MSKSSFSKRIHFIRHAQAQHKSSPFQRSQADNSSTYDYFVRDPSLTPIGIAQARSIPETYSFLPSSSALLVTSPLRRTIQTGLLAFNRNPLPHPGFQENSAKPCDTGSPLSILRPEFPELDFHLVSEGWDSKRGEWAPDEMSLAKRAAMMRKWLKDHHENEIIVITHGGNIFFESVLIGGRILVVSCSRG